jgi:hypothetical protein
VLVLIMTSVCGWGGGGELRMERALRHPRLRCSLLFTRAG